MEILHLVASIQPRNLPLKALTTTTVKNIVMEISDGTVFQISTVSFTERSVSNMIERFSIIIPVYNNSFFLKDCLASVLFQDYPNIEIIIADDGSELFNQLEIANFIETHNKGNIKKYVIFQNKKNLGTVKNLNIAIKRSSGNYIKLLAADDLFYDNEALTKISACLEKTTSDIIISDVMVCDSKGNSLYIYESDFLKTLTQKNSKECFSAICIRNPIMAVSVFFKKEYFEKFGLFDERFRLLEDWPTWLSFFSSGGKMDYWPILSVKYRKSTGVVSNNNPYYLADRRRIFIDIIKNNKQSISILTYVLAMFSSHLFSSSKLRKLYFYFIGFWEKD